MESGAGAGIMMVALEPVRRVIHICPIPQQKDTRHNDHLIVFKCTYSNAVRSLRISKEIRRLFDMLRGEVGQDFLREARVVCGYRVEQNCFLRTYAQNFVELHVPPAVGSGS